MFGEAAAALGSGVAAPRGPNVSCLIRSNPTRAVTTLLLVALALPLGAVLEVAAQRAHRRRSAVREVPALGRMAVQVRLLHDEVERLGVPVELPLERVEHPEQRGEEVRGVAEEVASCSGIRPAG